VSPDLRARAQGIQLLILDVDGVLTDGRLYYGDDGDELKAFHIHDGLGIKMLRETGIEVAIVTGRMARAVELRAENLGVAHVFQGVGDKLAVFEQLLKQFALPAMATTAMGDDLPDLPVLRRCGLAACVPEAPALVRSHSHFIANRSGGAGAVRELCELIMAAQGTLEARMEDYLK
jgi:3-deoxy-D-manno-octulosonate 8-phosphate phosphatase (KDO 8-P phosphatase)